MAVPHFSFNFGLGVRAATESTTIRSTALERTKVSAISIACSPVSGWEISSSSKLTPYLLGVSRVKGMLGVNKGGGAACLLGLGNHA